MRGRIASLTESCNKPLSGGIDKLDHQILKFRQLKEAYSGDGGSSYTDLRAPRMGTTD
jgi:hypothetical protein